MPDPQFEKLFEATDKTQWDSVDGVRQRARRRTRNTRIAATAAVVAAIGVISGGVAVAQNQTRPTPALTTSPSPSTPAPTSVPTSATAPSSPAPPTSPPTSTRPTSPSSTSRSPSPSTVKITDASFLQPADLGSGYRVDAGGEQGDWTFEFSAAVLPCDRPGRVLAPLDRRQRSLESDDGRLTQYVARYRSGDAGRYLEQLRDRVATCEPKAGYTVDLVAEEFAGDDALWIQAELGAGAAEHVLVRKGDLITEFTVDSISTGRFQEIARKAANRL